MKANGANWRSDHQLWIEVFVLMNFAGLIGDIFLAHSTNHFRRSSEYLPLYFSIAGTLALAAIVPMRRRYPAVWRDVGHLIGWSGIGVGLVGVLLHLDSRFFVDRTIESLTLVPFALAILLTFVLTPPVTWLQRWVGRVPAVLVAATLVFAALGLAAWGLTRQIDHLAEDLPGYRANIRTKIADVRLAGRGGAVEKLQETLEGIRLTWERSRRKEPCCGPLS
jgi:hypothetical protein